jgi:hypothetical protein
MLLLVLLLVRRPSTTPGFGSVMDSTALSASVLNVVSDSRIGSAIERNCSTSVKKASSTALDVVTAIASICIGGVECYAEAAHHCQRSAGNRHTNAEVPGNLILGF